MMSATTPRASPLRETNKQLHPLHQIALSATHKLLLKQWIKEEDLIARRTSLKEMQLDSVRREIAGLNYSFFIFHAITLVLLFSISTREPAAACRRSWIPCLCSLLCSMAMVWAIRYKADTEQHLEKLLEREREDGLLLGKCIEELKKKGVEFDLLKEVDALRRAKSLRLEAKGQPGMASVKRWSKKDFTVMFFFAASCGVLGLTRFVLCSQY